MAALDADSRLPRSPSAGALAVLAALGLTEAREQQQQQQQRQVSPPASLSQQVGTQASKWALDRGANLLLGWNGGRGQGEVA